MTIRVITNIRNLDKAVGPESRFEIEFRDGNRPLEVMSTFLRSRRHDFVLLNGALRSALMLGALKWVMPFHRARIVLLDIMLSTPRGLWGKLKAHLIGFLLSRTHRILVYYHNTQGLEHHYHIPSEKFEYIPFKVNQLEMIRSMTPVDRGFVFSGGKTRRDFTTLFEAVRGLDCAVRVVTMADSEITRHGTFVHDGAAPENVEIVRLDGGAEPFLSEMAAARLVVLPVTPEICGAAISVYIQAMALRKCVILTEGPAAEDVLTSGQAIIVPARDPVALRQAIERALRDDEYRAQFERNGYEWAMPLGGERELYERLLARLRDLHHGPDPHSLREPSGSMSL